MPATTTDLGSVGDAQLARCLEFTAATNQQHDLDMQETAMRAWIGHNTTDQRRWILENVHDDLVAARHAVDRAMASITGLVVVAHDDLEPSAHLARVLGINRMTVLRILGQRK